VIDWRLPSIKGQLETAFSKNHWRKWPLCSLRAISASFLSRVSTSRGLEEETVEMGREKKSWWGRQMWTGKREWRGNKRMVGCGGRKNRRDNVRNIKSMYRSENSKCLKMTMDDTRLLWLQCKMTPWLDWRLEFFFFGTIRDYRPKRVWVEKVHALRDKWLELLELPEREEAQRETGRKASSWRCPQKTQIE
jgi:hypothetical protein